jgi:hypothetical protein
MSVVRASFLELSMFGLMLFSLVPVSSLFTPIRKLVSGVPPFGGRLDFS